MRYANKHISAAIYPTRDIEQSRTYHQVHSQCFHMTVYVHQSNDSLRIKKHDRQTNGTGIDADLRGESTLYRDFRFGRRFDSDTFHCVLTVHFHCTLQNMESVQVFTNSYI